jgi:hypothetical protein
MRALLLLAIVLSLAASSAAAAPRVWLVRDHPIKVAGRGFVPSERVRVTVAYGRERYLLLARTTATGTFVARSTSSTKASCASLTVTAVGAAGDRAVYKVPASDC